MLWCFTKCAGACLGCVRAGRSRGGSGCEHKAPCSYAEVSALLQIVSAWHLLHGVLGVSQLESHKSLIHEGAAWWIHAWSVSCMGNCFMLGFECVELETAIPALIPSWSCFLWQYIILSFHMYRNGMVCDRQSGSTVLWRPAEYSWAADRSEKLAAAFTVSLMPRLKQEEQIQGQHSGGCKVSADVGCVQMWLQWDFILLDLRVCSSGCSLSFTIFTISKCAFGKDL